MCVRAKKIRGFSLALRNTLGDLLLYLVNLKLGINLRIFVIDFVRF